MARFARVVLPDFPHHVTQRGNRGEAVFYTNEDRECYIELLAKNARRWDLEIGAYCLMNNHVHFIAVPRNKDSLAKVMGVTHMMHSRAVNRQRGWKGHLWAERFYSTPLDHSHFLAAVPYVELNPVRAAMHRRAEDYKWSSARAHIDGIEDSLLSNDALFGLDRQVDDWALWLSQVDDRKKIDNLRKCTMTGRPCGSDEFIRNVERMTNRVVRKKSPGRKCQS